MGIKGSDCGISIQFCQNDGTPDGAPFYGRYTQLAGKARTDILSAGLPETNDEKKFPGSDDWLTLIAVADTEEKLKNILHHSSVPVVPPHTSMSSRRVCIEIDIGGVRQTFANRVAITSGPIVNLTPDKLRIDAVHVKVLPPNTELATVDGNSSFIQEFQGGSVALKQVLQFLATHPSGLAAKLRVRSSTRDRSLTVAALWIVRSRRVCYRAATVGSGPCQTARAAIA